MAFNSAAVSANDDILASQYNNLRTDLTEIRDADRNLFIPATLKLYLDGGSNTYISEDSADNIKFIAGAANGLSINATRTYVWGDLWLPTGKKVYFDSGSNTYITESGADTLQVYTGSSLAMTISSGQDIQVRENIIIEATKKLYLDGGIHTYIIESPANEIAFVAGGTLAGTFSATYLALPTGIDLILFPTQKLYLDNGSNTYIEETSSDLISLYAGGNQVLKVVSSYVEMKPSGSSTFYTDASLTLIYTDLLPSAHSTYDCGNASNYWNDVSYKTLTDRGCLGWFDEGVELQDGSIVPDTEALLAIEKDPIKTTIYGKPMLKYKTFPKVSYKLANKIITDEQGKKIGTELLPRDENDEPIG